MVGAHNRTGDQLREERDVEPEVENVGNVRDLPLIDIHQVADILEGIERDAHGQKDLGGVEIVRARPVVGPLRQPVDDLVLAADNRVVSVGAEVGVFEVEEYQQVDDYTRNHECLAPAVSPRLVHENAEEVV